MTIQRWMVGTTEPHNNKRSNNQTEASGFVRIGGKLLPLGGQLAGIVEQSSNRGEQKWPGGFWKSWEGYKTRLKLPLDFWEFFPPY